jgi:hypothetical protein
MCILSTQCQRRLGTKALRVLVPGRGSIKSLENEYDKRLTSFIKTHCRMYWMVCSTFCVSSDLRLGCIVMLLMDKDCK